MTTEENYFDTQKEEFQRMENTTRQRMEDSSFHCSEQWHLADLSPICSLIYPLAYRLSRSNANSTQGSPGTLHCSAERLAIYFGRDPSTIRRGLNELVRLGFLIKVGARKFKPNVYRVRTHAEWANDNPGKCAVKLFFPYSEEGDPLGRQLWNICGGLIEFKTYQVAYIRTLGLNEEAILKSFTSYWENHDQSKSAKQLTVDFIVKLKKAAFDEQARAA